MSKIKSLWKDRQNQYKYAKWLMLYTKPYLGRITLMMLFSLSGTVSSLFMVNLSKKIIDNATEGKEFVTLIVGYLVLVLGLQVVGVISSLMSTILSEKFSSTCSSPSG